MVDLTELCGRRLVALVALAISSCSPVNVGGQQSTPATSSSPVSGKPAEPVDISKAWPHVPVRTRDSSTFGEVAITPDGRVALGQASPPSPLSPPLGPAIVDRQTGELTIIRRFSNRYMQVVSIVGDNDWVAWVEGSIQPSFVDWVLYSYDRHSGQIRTLAAAPKPFPVTPYITLSMSNGVVVWSAVMASDGIFHVYAVNADGSNLRAVAADAKGPQIVWPWVVYDVKPSAPGASAPLMRQNLETGDIRRIPGPTDVSYFAYDGEALAWISVDSNHILLQSPFDSRPIELYSGRYVQFPSINRRLVGWGQDRGAFVYDRKLHTVVQLSDLYDFYPVISDAALDWLYQPDPNAVKKFEGTVWRAVNVGDLP